MISVSVADAWVDAIGAAAVSLCWQAAGRNDAPNTVWRRYTSKSRSPNGECGFDSHLRHQIMPINTASDRMTRASDADFIGSPKKAEIWPEGKKAPAASFNEPTAMRTGA